MRNLLRLFVRSGARGEAPQEDRQPIAGIAGLWSNSVQDLLPARVPQAAGKLCGALAMDGLLRIAVQSAFKRGNLKVTGAGGTTFTAGDGSGQRIAIRFTTRAAQWACLLDPELKVGEAYMDGTL